MKLLGTGLAAFAVGASLLVPVQSAAWAVGTTPSAGTDSTVAGLSVFVGYAEDKEINTPAPASFPVPWAGAPNTVFLGGTVPGQAACGTLTVCYDTGAIRLDNPGSTPLTVSKVSVDMHSSLTGGKVFNNLWGSFTVAPGRSVILAANPPASNPSYDNFDTSGYPGNQCTPLTVAPTVTITVAGVATTLADSTHVLDTGGIDAGYCKHNESIQWRPIGAAGTSTASLTLDAPATTAFAGRPSTQSATLLDGGGAGIPNAAVRFTVTNGPNVGVSGTASTDYGGRASFTYTSAISGQDEIVASVTTVGSFASAPARVLWTNDSVAGWSATEIGSSSTPGDQSLDTTSGQWTIHGSGAGIAGTSDQFHFLSQSLTADGGIGARLTQPPGTVAQQGAVMLRSSTDPGSPYYAAIRTPDGAVTIQDRAVAGGPTTALARLSGPGSGHLWVNQAHGRFTSYTSVDGSIWNPVAGSAVVLNLAAGTLAGLAVASGSASQRGTLTADDVTVGPLGPAPPPPVPCPTPFTCADIGNPTPAGNQSFDPGTGAWTINASGTDITSTADQFRFVSQPVSGDSTLSTQVMSQTNTSSSAKAGVMIRSTSDPGSPYYGVFLTPGTGIKVQRRTVQGGGTTKLANPAGTVPAYLRVVRSGAQFTAFTSSDGITWTPIAGSSTTMTLPSAVLEGLAFTSHKSGTLGTVTMANTEFS